MAIATVSPRATDALTSSASGAPLTNITPLAHSVPVAARLLGIGHSKAWALIAQGKIRAIRLGRRTLIPAREIERVLENGA